jgi:hypothetical protein
VARTGSVGGRSGGAVRWDGCRFGRRVERAFDVSHRSRFPRPSAPCAPRQEPIRAERQWPAKEWVQHSSARGHVAGVPGAFAVIAVTARRHCRRSARGPASGQDDVTVGTCMQTQRGRPRGNGPRPVSPAAPGNERDSRDSGGGRPCIPGQLAAKNACSATMATRSHTRFCLLSTHCRSVATPCSRVLLGGGDPRRLIQAMVFSLSVLHSALDACC